MAIYLSLTGRAILLHNRAKNIVFSHAPYFISIQSLMSWHMKLSPRSQMLIITIIYNYISNGIWAYFAIFT